MQSLLAKRRRLAAEQNVEGALALFFSLVPSAEEALAAYDELVSFVAQTFAIVACKARRFTAGKNVERAFALFSSLVPRAEEALGAYDKLILFTF